MKINFKVVLFCVIIIAILFAVVIYTFARNKFVKIPGNGSDIPNNWNPSPTVLALYNSMSGIGTNEDMFFSTLSPLTNGQKALIYNKYLEVYGHTIIEDITGDFEGTDLTRALDAFKDIPGITLRLAFAKLGKQAVNKF